MANSKSIQETSIMLSFSILPDPRKNRNQIHSLFDIISTAILSVLCGADNWIEVAFWADSNLEWLKQFGICLNGAPSHDTFNRFFRFVDPLSFEKCFISWTQKVANVLGGVIALDGKAICGSKKGGEKAIHLVSAFSASNGIVLGQLATEAKSNEITAFPLLIEMLDLKGAIVTIDAAGCQKKVVEKICEKKGDYVLALKGNQRCLHAEVENFFRQVLEVSPEEANCDFYISEEKSRDRWEKREVWATMNLDWLPQASEWEGLRSLVLIRSTRTIKGKSSTELKYYISSLFADAQKQGQAVRAHWGVENKLHWQLDVSYREDDCRVYRDSGPENFSILRRATLNLLKADKKTKAGIKSKRSKAGWNRKYMLEILGINC